MIRILHYIGTLELGGSQSFVMELYRNIDRTKIQFDFIIFEGWRGPLYEEIISLGGRVFESPKYNGLNHFEFIKWWNRFFSLQQGYNVLHGHVRSVAAIYLPIAREHGVFTILHSHSASNGTGLEAAVKLFLQLPVRYMADYYMACSVDAGRWLFGKRTVNGNRYRTIPNAINTERFVFKPEIRDRMRHEYGLDNQLVLGHVGRFVEVKNHLFLLNIIAKLLDVRQDVKLLLIGDGPLKKEIENKCRKMRLSEHVIFAGSRLNTEDFYQAMDVFVFPSKWEGLGIVSIEAQTSGLPCVVSDGVPKSVDIGAGLVKRLSLDDVSEWVDSIVKMNTNKRESKTTEVKASGYDIHDNTVKMMYFYEKAYRIGARRKRRREGYDK